MNPTGKEIGFLNFASDYVRLFPKLKKNCLIKSDFKNCNWHIEQVDYNATTPTRVSSNRNRIELKQSEFKKLSEDVQLLALLWCFYKRNGGKYLTDSDADISALKLFFHQEPTLAEAPFLIRIYKEWFKVIGKNFSQDYKTQRINKIKSYINK